MADEADLRRIVASLDDVEEISSEGFDFRTEGRGFVWSYPERRPGQRRPIRTDIAVVYVGDEAEKQALVRVNQSCSSPRRPRPTGRWSWCGWRRWTSLA